MVIYKHYLLVNYVFISTQIADTKIYLPPRLMWLKAGQSNNKYFPVLAARCFPVCPVTASLFQGATEKGITGRRAHNPIHPGKKKAVSASRRPMQVPFSVVYGESSAVAAALTRVKP
ncbi:hypothetical protein AVG36_11885 [Salmonella enterica subsp. enterica serovar Kentucky]|nr:hypothetical protein [Salmonella enterica subsp. enterica serovar Kentucky]ECB7570893.1 hypothetical protein [Salmonella enterica subsp. enterica serovar Kentucky]EEA8663842.1 hypothetical protein [Salmonella enterica subsp. enterica]EEC3104138.1 hypothetical protein [Salmonella enterica subsp. enterica serovar Kentucky]